MSFSQVDNVTIEAICGCVPKNEINNAEIGKELFQEELDNVILATGIEKRRVCKKPTTTALDLSVTAAQTIFKKAISIKMILVVLFLSHLHRITLCRLMQEPVNTS